MPAAFTGKKSLAGQKDGRHFAAGRETGIFPAKSAFAPPMCPRQAKFASQQISTPRLKLSKNPPAGRPRTFVSYRRAIFMGHSVRILSTEDRPADAGMLSVNWQRPPKAGGRKAQDCGRERACNLAPKAQPVAPGEERVIHSSRPPDRGKKRFWCLLGLRPKGTAARHPCVSCDKLLRRIRAYTFVCLTESAMRRFLWEFCAQRKTSPPVTAPILAPRPDRAADYRAAYLPNHRQARGYSPPSCALPS